MVKIADNGPTNWSKIPALEELGFDELCMERTRLYDLGKKCEKDLKEINEQIQNVLQMALPEGERKVQWKNFQVMINKGRAAAKLDEKLLLEAGVDAQIIADATIPGKEYTYIQFVADKEK